MSFSLFLMWKKYKKYAKSTWLFSTGHKVGGEKYFSPHLQKLFHIKII